MSMSVRLVGIPSIRSRSRPDARSLDCFDDSSASTTTSAPGGCATARRIGRNADTRKKMVTASVRFMGRLQTALQWIVRDANHPADRLRNHQARTLVVRAVKQIDEHRQLT